MIRNPRRHETPAVDLLIRIADFVTYGAFAVVAAYFCVHIFWGVIAIALEGRF